MERTAAGKAAAQPVRQSQSAIPLGLAAKGEPLTVLSIRGRDDSRRFLEDLGFVEGSEIQVVSEMNGSLIVDVKGSRIALGRDMAMRIMVA